ncbi:MAG TPA: hypothetical protein VD866_08135 [Urbifossiella sp.]|nr:hypothetical protein [Urbifossiella sp.]
MRFTAATLPFGGKVVFGRAAVAEGAPAGHPAGLRGKAAARHAREVKLAADLCPVLPEPGEHVHCLMTGFFGLAPVIADVAARTNPRAVRIATLCWSARNVIDLAGMMERRHAVGDPLTLTLVVSDFFRQHNKDLVEHTRAQLAPFGGVRIVPCRSHAKVTTFDLGPGDGLTFEGSANLRTNRNVEQLTIIRDRVTHDWHAAWIDRLAGAAA